MKTNESSEEKESTDETDVPLSEVFQKEVMSLVGKATKKECSFMRDCVMEREDELRKEESGKDEGPGYSDFKAVKAKD